MAIALNLEDLNKIRYPVGICEGFDLAEFDKIVLVKLRPLLFCQVSFHSKNNRFVLKGSIETK